MYKLGAALILFIIASLIYLLDVFFPTIHLELYSSPILIPTITFYYFKETKAERIDFLFFLTILLIFIGEIAYLAQGSSFLDVRYFFYTLVYCLIFYLLFNGFKNLVREKALKTIEVSFLIIFVLIFYLLYSFINLSDIKNDLHYYFFITFGILLSLIASLASILFLYKGSNINFFALFTSASFILSEIFFTLKLTTDKLVVFELFARLFQVLSYYFFVRYFLEQQQAIN